MQNLPSIRQLLDSLVASLSQHPPRPLRQDKGAGASRRRLLLTLHALFPSIVLPALDLLDRGLVARLRAAPDRGARERPGLGGGKPADDGSGEGGEAASPSASCAVPVADDAPLARLYVVQSLASTLTRPRGREPASASRTYAVHLDAWSCSYAGFALEAFARYALPAAAFPLSEPRASPPSTLLPPTLEAPDVALDSQRLSFGGFSTDGLPGFLEDVPCCKHLLACLLAEAWPALLSNGVDDSIVTKREVAGTAAGIH